MKRLLAAAPHKFPRTPPTLPIRIPFTVSRLMPGQRVSLVKVDNFSRPARLGPFNVPREENEKRVLGGPSIKVNVAAEAETDFAPASARRAGN